MNITRIILLTTICVLFLSSHGLAWNEKFTHNIITRVAAKNSVLSQSKGDYLSLLGFDNGLLTELSWPNSDSITSGSIESWLIEGAKLEDTGKWSQTILGSARSLNHFHNPLQPWSSAGLSDVSSGESSLLWAQDATNQATKVGGDWSWNTIRTYYYTALTSISDTTRQEYSARTFRGVGHQMHLVQDKSVPAHVRNDSHAQDAMGWRQPDNLNLRLETWATKNIDNMENDANLFTTTPSAYYPTVSLNVPISDHAPITQLMDADIYTGINPTTSLSQGLAEYTNANFASEFTIFAENKPTTDIHYFPYPRASSTDLQSYIDEQKLPETVIAADLVPDTSFWIKKTGDGETINHFVRPGYFADNINRSTDSELFKRTFYLDEFCHKDFANKLIPRAVGYSAALIDYFFRGKIDISVPANGLYSMIPGTATEFTSVKLRAKNSSIAGEEMTDGSIQLVVKYKVAQEDPFKSGPVPTTPNFSYIVVPEKNSIRLISRAYTDFNFDLSQTPIPLYATDVYLQLVYKGKLGNENGAVAVGFKDISEPTPIDMFNNMDKICMNGSWYNAGSPEAIAQVDSNHDGIAEADVYAYDLKNIYFRFSPYSTSPPYYAASAAVHDFMVPLLAKSDHVRAVYILGDYQFNKAQYLTQVKLDPTDPYTRPDINSIYFHSAVKRQKDYSTNSASCGGNPPCYVDVYPEHRDAYSPNYFSGFYTFRNATMWWGSVKLIVNTAYPTGSQCSYDLLN